MDFLTDFMEGVRDLNAMNKSSASSATLPIGNQPINVTALFCCRGWASVQFRVRTTTALHIRRDTMLIVLWGQ